MLEEVTHFFVIAKILRKDGSDTGRFRSWDCFNYDKATAMRDTLNAKEDSHTPFIIVKYKAYQKPIYLKIKGKLVKDFNSMHTPPKCVKEAYERWWEQQ